MNANRNAQFFALDGLKVPILATVKVQQTYETLGGRDLSRSRNGRARLQVHWQKLKTVLSGSGWRVAPFSGVDQTVLHTLDCVSARALQSVQPVFQLPDQRQDIPPRGFAVVGGELVRTASAFNGSTLALTPHPQAESYVCWYWPQLTGYLTLTEQGDPRGGDYSWTLTLEEA